MTAIMASHAGLAGLLAGLGLSAAPVANANAAAADADSFATGAYSLSYDKDSLSDGFSVFQMSIADRFSVLGSGFATSDDPRLKPLTRLDSAWNLAAPVFGVPARIGDGVSSINFWDQPARMGGIQIGTSQPIVPAVIAPPAALFAPVELGPVPFAATSNRFIDNLGGLLSIQHQTLIASGQSDFSFESGRLRENFELHSNDYGPWLTSGTYRYGLGSTTTVDGQFAQVFGQQSVVGLGVLEGIGTLGSVSAKLASSRDPYNSTGWLAGLGYDFSRDRLSLAVRSHVQSAAFQEAGDASTLATYRERTLASARLDLGSLGRLSMASATQIYTDDSRRDVVALSHAIPFGRGGILSSAAAYSPGQLGNSALVVSFTYPFNYFSGADRNPGAIDWALDRSIVDVFGQPRIAPAGSYFNPLNAGLWFNPVDVAGGPGSNGPVNSH